MGDRYLEHRYNLATGTWQISQQPSRSVLRAVQPNESLHRPPDGNCHASCSDVFFGGTNRARCLALASSNVIRNPLDWCQAIVCS